MKLQLTKAVLLGLCMSTIATGTVFAQAGGGESGSSPAFAGEAQSDELTALYEKQSEIDKYLFKDHAKDIEEKGFRINYTGVIEDKVEIGISPYSDENAEYLYEIFGKDVIHVVESEVPQLYTAEIATTAVADEPTVDGTLIAPDTPVSSDAELADDGEMSIQIESVGEAEDSDMIYETVSADATEEQEVRLVSATDEVKENGVSAPVMVLAIAGGAALIGGVAVVSSKKKQK